MAEEVVLAAKTAEQQPAPTMAAAAEPTLASRLPIPHNDVVEEKAIVKAERPSDPILQKSSKGSLDRDVALAEVEKEKKLSFIKAWEESEKTKAENKAQKKLSEVSSWENSKKAAIEAKLKKFEETLQKKKADYGETMKNKIAEVHKQAEEKRAMVDARRQEEILKAEETSAKYRATNQTPKQVGCFGC